MTSQTPEENTTEIEDWKEEFFSQEDEFGYSVDTAASGGDLNNKDYVRKFLTPKLHQQLQKARDAIFQELPNGEVAIHIPAEFKDKPLWVVSNNSKVLLHHPELDQDTELLNSVKEDWDKQAKNAMNGLDQDVSK